MIPQRGQNPGYARAIVLAPSPGEGVPDRSIGGTHSRGTFGLAIPHPDRLHRGARAPAARLCSRRRRPRAPRSWPWSRRRRPPTPTEDPPTAAPPTKKPAKTKKPKPTPTPVTWSDAYRTHVCSAIASLSDAKTHLDAAAAQLTRQNYPGARAEAYQIVALALQATDQIPTVKAWPPGRGARGAAHRLGQQHRPRREHS